MHSWNTFGAQMNHMHTWIHKTHHGPDLGEATTFPLIIFSMIAHGDCTQMSFFLGPPSWESQNSQNWDFRHFGSP
jgi:hypothetical protein